MKLRFTSEKLFRDEISSSLVKQTHLLGEPGCDKLKENKKITRKTQIKLP